MSERQRYSLYHVHSEDGILRAQNGEIVDLTAFSKFKHGSGNEAAKYGEALAEGFTTTHPELIQPDIELVVTASISKLLPLASDSLADAFYDSLNYTLYTHNAPPAERIKIHRSELVEGDYSALGEAERKKVVQRDHLSLPEGVVSRKNLLVIDDVRMTGFHEEKIHEYVQSLDTLSVWYLYALDMDERLAKEDPTLEARMNKAYVSDLTALAEVVTAKDFLMNSRVCKFVIDYNNKEELQTFLSEMDDTFLYSLFTGATGNGYNRMERYEDSVHLIEAELKSRGLIADGRLHAPEQ